MSICELQVHSEMGEMGDIPSPYLRNNYSIRPTGLPITERFAAAIVSSASLETDNGSWICIMGCIEKENLVQCITSRGS